MARKTAQYTVTDEGRDQGKIFLLTEMPVTRAEAWATRILLALLGANVQLPDNFEKLGVAALAEVGLKALGQLKWEVLEPLLAEMLDCVQFIGDPKKPNIVRALFEGDIEEIPTLIKIRMEVWQLHMGFLQAVVPLVGRASAVAAASEDIRQKITRMSQRSSAR